MQPLGEEVFNPLDKTNLAESVRDHLLKRPVVQLPPDRFMGAGIYAIYYTGGFQAYRKIARVAPSDEKAIPIYVGKAVPAGSRKGGYGLAPTQRTFYIGDCWNTPPRSRRPET